MEFGQGNYTIMANNMSQESSQGTPDELELPPKFESIQSLMDISNVRLDSKPLVNVIGVVRDFQPPIKTRGTDYKCTITIFDWSTQYENQYGKIGIQVNVFYPLEKIPRIDGAGDVLLIRNVKVQMFGGFISLLAHYSSEINIFKADSIPRWPLNSITHLNKAFISTIKPMTQKEAAYVVWIKSFIRRDPIPASLEFQQRANEAMKSNDKFSLFKDFREGRFYDIVAEVIRVFEIDGRATVYLTDYTAHSLFYDHKWGGAGMLDEGRDGDEFNYMRGKAKKADDWPGPFGKMALQLTAFDEHCGFIRDNVENKSWVRMNNIQVKMGTRGGLLEGFLRGDRQGFGSKLAIEKLTVEENSNDIRWKEALSRKYHYEKKFKKQTQEIMAEQSDEEKPTNKRKSDGTNSKRNAKKQRREKIAAGEHAVAVYDQNAAEALGLNGHVRCTASKREATSLRDILDRSGSRIRIDNRREILSTFTNLRYRANVRVVDFFPHRLEDFTIGRRITEYDMLSDYSGNESTDKEEDMKQYRAGKGYGGPKKWEWRFALLVEDANQKTDERDEKVWLMVDNQSSQFLLGMDAVNLHADEKCLEELRQKLFQLWGDLEEKKTAFLRTKAGKTLRWAISTPERSCQDAADSGSEHRSEGEDERPLQKKPRTFDAPPVDSDEENDKEHQPKKGKQNSTAKAQALAERNANVGHNTTPREEDVKAIRKMSQAEARRLWDSKIKGLGVTNKGFSACIEQYGIKVSEEDEEKADAGEGKRWERMFALFGTNIA